MEFIESKTNTPIISYGTKLMPEMTTFSKVSDFIKDLTYDYIDTEL